MVRLHLLSCLLLLPLAACFPLLDREAPMDTTGGPGGGLSWADLAGVHPAQFPRWLRAPHPQALLVMAKELQMSGRARAAFGLRSRRQNDGRGKAGSLLADGEKASSLLETLADEFSSHDKKKGGFHFRFGRR